MFRLGVLAALLGAVVAPQDAPAQQAAPVKMRFAYVPALGAAPLFVLVSAGWAKEAGLDITPVRFDSGPPAISAVASGTIDAFAIGVAPVAVAKARGLDVKIVSAVVTGGSGFVAGAALSKAFEANGNDAARAFEAFRLNNRRPARLATIPPGGVPNVLLNHWLFKLNNVKREDAQIVTLGIDAIQQAILTGAVDGGTVVEPSQTIVLQRDPSLKMIVAANEMFEGIPGVVIGVTGAFAKANPGAVDKLVSLVVRANELVRTRPDEAAAHVLQALGGGLVDRATLARALASKTVAYVADPGVIEEPTRRMLQYQTELGDFDKAPSIDGLFDRSPYARATRN